MGGRMFYIGKGEAEEAVWLIKKGMAHAQDRMNNDKDVLFHAGKASAGKKLLDKLSLFLANWEYQEV